MNKVKEGSVIQVNEKIPEWFGCLLVVKEVKMWGVLAGMKIPFHGDTCIRLNNDQFDYIGKSTIIPCVER